jgi:hypothetical protein
MSKLLMSLLAVAAIGCGMATPSAAQSEPAQASEPVRTNADIDQAFADVAAASTLDPDAANAFREQLYRAGLKQISAVTYDEWVSATAAGKDYAWSRPE